MFPTLNYVINYLFGTDLTFNFPPTFGFLVALSFLAAAWTLSVEMKRKEKLGLVAGVKRKIIVGLPATFGDLAGNALLGFILGFKILGAITESDLFQQNPQAYILSLEGNWIGGLAVAAIFGYLRYREKHKQRLPEPKEETVHIRPQQMVGSMTMVAALWGIIGAKLFHNLEYWELFVEDPMGSLFSVSGLTFYGGLIGGFLGVWWYSRRQKLSFVHVCDATAPGLMLAYALGRIGCLMAGDGDWGIVNSAYRISPHQHYAVVHDDSLQHDLQLYYPYFDANTPEEVEHARMERPDALAFLPHWFFAFNFPHNVNNQGIPIPGCRGNYCSMLPLPVFPTMLYETVVCLLLFGFLWFMRPRISVPGKMFSLYLMINGAERLLIEQIRVNTTVNLFGMTVTQAEILAVMLIIIGLTGLLVLQRFSERILKL